MAEYDPMASRAPPQAQIDYKLEDKAERMLNGWKLGGLFYLQMRGKYQRNYTNYGTFDSDKQKSNTLVVTLLAYKFEEAWKKA